MRKKGPTIKDVAARAGVSVMAVSRVCNPSATSQVSAAMREKVMKAIKELGYQPDTVARSLRRRRSDTVGFYNGYRGMMLLEEDFPRSIFTGLQDESTELAQDLLIFNVPEEPRSPAEVVRELSTSKVDGVVFLPQEGDEELARLLGESHQNVVAIGEALPGLPAITAQDALGSRKIAEYLYSLGHRHVMYRRARVKLMSARRRYEAFIQAAREIGIDVTETETMRALDELDDREQEIVRNHKQREITAIVAWHDYSAVKVVLFCRENGIDVPGDLAVVGFDQLPPLLCPPEVDLTTIAVDWTEVAKRGVEYVVRGREYAARMEDGDEVLDDEGTFEIRLRSELHIGNTT
jgi:DNA-binding LacI/PurR family transcriptional regulator